MAKLPSFQFYPGDWLKDSELSRCSQAARGVWIDLLCLMFDCNPRGVLASSGEAWTDEEIASSLRGDHKINLHCIHELVKKGVARRRDDGALTCKRMICDETERIRWRESKQVSRQCPENVPPMSRPSSSSSSDKRESSKILSGQRQSASKPKPKPRPRNLLWDALQAAFYPSGVAPGQERHFGALVRDFKFKGATPEEIKKRIARYQSEWPTISCTPNALLEHWDTFGPQPRPDWMPEPKKGVGEL